MHVSRQRLSFRSTRQVCLETSWTKRLDFLEELDSTEELEFMEKLDILQAGLWQALPTARAGLKIGHHRRVLRRIAILSCVVAACSSGRVLLNFQVQGICRTLKTDPEDGIPATPEDIAARQEKFGTNTHPEKPAKPFWVSAPTSTLKLLLKLYLPKLPTLAPSSIAPACFYL